MFKKQNKKSSHDAMVKNTGLPRSLWRFYLSYGVRGYRWILVVWAILGLVAMFNDTLFPLVNKWIVQLFEGPLPADGGFIMHALPTILLITGLNMAMSFALILQEWAYSHWAPQINQQMSTILTDYVHHQSMSFWTGRMSGQVHSQMGQITDGVFALRQVWISICRLSIIFVNAFLLFFANRYVAYMFIGIVLFRVVYAWRMRIPLKRTTKQRATVISKLSGKLVDSISNYSVVKLFARARGEEKYLAPTRRERVDITVRYGFIERLFHWVPGVMWDVFLGLTILLCAFLYARGEITTANAVFSVSIYISVMGAISRLIDVVPDVIDKLSTASRAYEELVVPIEVADSPNAKPLKVKHGAIEFKSVSFSYKRKKVLDNLTLTIKPGERVGLVGVSGAGKTTMVNLLMRFYDPKSGQILIDGQNIRDVTQDSLRENIAFIPQEPMMFNRTLGENIGYGKVDATRAEIRRAAKSAAADEFIMGTEKKYDSMVGDRGIKLSGGQRQRVAIARAFLKDAPILILDEATSALDSETEVAIQRSFDELARGRTTIAIAHRLSTLRNMDRIVVLDHGKIIEMGTHAQLLRRGGEYARLWRMQSGGFIQE